MLGASSSGDIPLTISRTLSRTGLPASRTLAALALCAAAAFSPDQALAEIFAINRGDSSVLVFEDDADGGAPPVRRIAGPATGLRGLNGIALDLHRRELFVSSQTNQILVFDIDATGNVAPLRAIAGPATRLSFPAALAVDPVNDELIAVNLLGDGVLVFDRAASGNAEPLRTIEGPSTGIVQPTGIFVDLADQLIWVTNESSAAPAVQAFERSANGDVPPVRSIAGPATRLASAVGLFRDPLTRELTVADRARNVILTFAPDANGNASPIRSATVRSFSIPAGLTLTFDGEVLVGNNLGDAIVGIRRDDEGTVIPIRNLSGPSTRVSRPVYVATTQSPFPGAVFDPSSLVYPQAGVISADASRPPIAR